MSKVIKVKPDDPTAQVPDGTKKAGDGHVPMWPLYLFYLLCILFGWWLFQIEMPDKCHCHDGLYAGEKDCAPARDGGEP